MSKKKIASMLSGVVLLLFIALIALSVPKSNLSASAHDIPNSKFDKTDFTELTYGIYWYQLGSDVPVAAKKATNFDPTKPTLIYAHGMKAGNEGLRCREGLSLKDNNSEYMDYAYQGEFYQTLIDQGYNVGVFYWNQLSDCPPTDDYKFWVPENYGKMYYTYIDEDGKYQQTEADDKTNPTCSVTALYRDCLIEALGKDFSGRLHLTGHSMGGQLTLAVSQALCYACDQGKITSNYLPDRVTILDPYLGGTVCTGKVDTTGEKLPEEGKMTALLAAEAAKNVADHGIPIEAYGVNTSAYDYYILMLSKDKDKITHIRTLFNENITWVYLNAMKKQYGSFIPTHTMAVDYYFSTMYMNTKTDNGGVIVPSFKTTDEQIRMLKGRAFRQTFDESVASPNALYMCDSSFVRINGVTQKEVEATPLGIGIGGKVTETDKQLTVKLLLDGETVAETRSIEGNYLFTDVEPGDYTLAFYWKKTKVGKDQEISVTSSDVVITAEDTTTTIPKTSASPKTTSGNTVWVIVGIVAAAVLVIIILVAVKRRR